MCLTRTRGMRQKYPTASGAKPVPTPRRSAVARPRAPPRHRHAAPAARRRRARPARSPPPADRAARSSCPPWEGPSRRSLRSSLLLPVDGPLQLVLVHARAALDVQLLRLVVELVARATFLSVGARALSPTLARRLRIARRAPRSGA